jgi:hypothetical protein
MQGKKPIRYHKGYDYAPTGARRPVNNDAFVNNTGTGMRVDYDTLMSGQGFYAGSADRGEYDLGRAGNRKPSFNEHTNDDKGYGFGGVLTPVRPPMRPDTGSAAKSIY